MTDTMGSFLPSHFWDISRKKSKGPLGDARVICEGYKKKHLSTCKFIEKVVFWRFTQREHRAQTNCYCRERIAENVLLFEHLQNLICNSRESKLKFM